MLDLLGSFLIGGTIILMIVNLNIAINNSGQEIFKSTYSQSAAVSSALTVENDLYKAGYRSTGNKILMADSTNIIFTGDLDNNNIQDTVYFYRGILSATADYPLFRQVNFGTAIMVGQYSVCVFVYYDSLGNNISYSSLSSQTGRNAIRSIEFTAQVKWPVPNEDSLYQSTVWRKLISPRNL